MNSEVILIGLLVVAAVAGFHAARRARDRGRREAELEAAPLRERAEAAETRFREAEARLDASRAELQAALNEKSALGVRAANLERVEEELRNLRKQAEADSLNLREAQTELRELRDRAPRTLEAMRLEFSDIAGKLLKEKGEDFTNQNKVNLEGILNPLRDRINEFKAQVESTQKEGHSQHIQLKAQIEGLLGMNKQLSLEAQNLTTALKGENKTGGNWGEIVLERVLEMSGLEKGREYDLQQAYANEEGKRKLPDAVVHLPEQRQLVIDSKLSLLAYERYCSSENPEAAAAELHAHVGSVRQHVKNLAEQRYQDLPGLRTPDFVFLFMPIEPAFIVAVKQDSSLFQEAFDRNIIIVSPSTLLATLRTVANIWKQEYRHKHVLDIADQAGLLYDKFVGFLDDLKGVGDNLAKAQDNFAEAKKKLKDGTGNLVGRVENLRKLGAKAKKKIPPAWLETGEEPSGDAPALPLE